MMFYMYVLYVHNYTGCKRDYNGELSQIASVCTNLRQIKLAYS